MNDGKIVCVRIIIRISLAGDGQVKIYLSSDDATIEDPPDIRIRSRWFPQ
jgi:hypothetical protein